MNVSIGVEKFGKIEKAEITLGRLILFVGENNSGKTYMMQLLYGVTSAIIDHPQLVMKKNGKDDSEYLVDSDDIATWEKTINEYLEHQKEQIVRDIFYRDIPIGKLYVKIDDLDSSYLVKLKKVDLLHEINGTNASENDFIYEIRIRKNKKGTEEHVRGIRLSGNVDKKLVIGFARKKIVADMLGMRLNERTLFLPTSRTGMLLLYKYFFAEKDHQGFMMDSDDEEQITKNQLGLSAPVYDFLQFLLRFTPDNLIRAKDQEILDFIEEYLIEGKIELSGEESYYVPKDTEQRIPLYLSSSLINELAPVVKMLSSVMPYDSVYYDEIETCLHPLKQKAMARLMIRLANSGRRMIISTHSDSMAINMNNLLTFTLGSWGEERKEQKMKELQLEESDILQTKDVHVYQFSNMVHGTSTARELEFRTVNNLGYDFELFNQNLQNLSNDTIKIMG